MDILTEILTDHENLAHCEAVDAAQHVRHNLKMAGLVSNQVKGVPTMTILS